MLNNLLYWFLCVKELAFVCHHWPPFPKNISGSEQFLSYKFKARYARSASQILNFPLILINTRQVLKQQVT